MAGLHEGTAATSAAITDLPRLRGSSLKPVWWRALDDAAAAVGCDPGRFGYPEVCPDEHPFSGRLQAPALA
jgi:hypothetical protein